MVFAVGTSSSVLIYSTESVKPIYGIGNYHYAPITDLAWRESGMLAISSSDGFCSFIVFGNDELGEKYEATGELAELVKSD